VDSIRIKTNEYEMIIGQTGNFTFILSQTPHKIEVKVEGEKKEGEAEKKE
jgi:hypothetical protein